MAVAPEDFALLLTGGTASAHRAWPRVPVVVRRWLSGQGDAPLRLSCRSWRPCRGLCVSVSVAGGHTPCLGARSHDINVNVLFYSRSRRAGGDATRRAPCLGSAVYILTPACNDYVTFHKDFIFSLSSHIILRVTITWLQMS